MEHTELLKKLNTFYIYANKGFYMDEVFAEKKYAIAYSKNISDCYWNYVINLDIDTKEFCEVHKEITAKMKALKRDVCYIVSPLYESVYQNRKEIFEANGMQELFCEGWQVFDKFNELDKIETNCTYNIVLAKTDDMKMFAAMNTECFHTGDPEDPYGTLSDEYLTVYENYKEEENANYTRDFFVIKENNHIIGVSVSVYGDGICGIYGLAIKKEYRGKGIGKEALKKQLQICKEKNIKVAFLQTEEGFYPADMYRKFGFKDVCSVYAYAEKK